MIFEPPMVSPNTELAYDSKIEGDVIVSRLDAVINWIRTNSMWPMPMGLACCAIAAPYRQATPRAYGAQPSPWVLPGATLPATVVVG